MHVDRPAGPALGTWLFKCEKRVLLLVYFLGGASGLIYPFYGSHDTENLLMFCICLHVVIT